MFHLKHAQLVFRISSQHTIYMYRKIINTVCSITVFPHSHLLGQRVCKKGPQAVEASPSHLLPPGEGGGERGRRESEGGREEERR